MLKKLFKKQADQVNHHFVFIEAPIELVIPEIILWGEASWWPEDVSTRFVNKTPGDVKVGTQYHQECKIPGVNGWDVEVTGLEPNKSIERTFKSGIIKGYEKVSAEERVNGTRVDYDMIYQIQGIHNQVLWTVLFERMHDKNLRKILKALERHVLNIYKNQQEKELGDS